MASPEMQGSAPPTDPGLEQLIAAILSMISPSAPGQAGGGMDPSGLGGLPNMTGEEMGAQGGGDVSALLQALALTGGGQQSGMSNPGGIPDMGMMAGMSPMGPQGGGMGGMPGMMPQMGGQPPPQQGPPQSQQPPKNKIQGMK